MSYIDKVSKLIDEFYTDEVLHGASEEDALYESIENYRSHIIKIGVSEVDDFVDQLGHLNNTALAKWLADILNLYYPDSYDIPDNVFEIAYEVGEATGTNEY